MSWRAGGEGWGAFVFFVVASLSLVRMTLNLPIGCMVTWTHVVYILSYSRLTSGAWLYIWFGLFPRV